ncbi:carboxymuconolactone decarboxylase family protein [Kitasatospora camelliae]|uniref:Carboxymuconolactone decarboxylase family protein n=1 Tax=Kitasatospora camelliae TaxID=3156397 RepID=A0AAU8JSZ0_9ACTN
MPSPYRHTPGVPKNAATGLVARVYAQMAEDFLLADGPLMSLSPAPEVLAATWALLREAELAGEASRIEKEAAASAVSRVNRCPFCTEAHALLVHGAGDHRLAESVRTGAAPQDSGQAAVVAWAEATRSPGAPDLAAPPFPERLAPEFLGTALATHFINRMVTSLLDEPALLPGAVHRSQLVRRVAGRVVQRAARLLLAPGRSLELLGPEAESGPVPAWAGPGPIGRAYAALRAVGERGGRTLGAEGRAAVLAAVAAWDGTHPPLGGGRLESPLGGLGPDDRPAARLALLAALAPYRITDEQVAEWRERHGEAADGGELVRVLAFGAMAAVTRVEGWITAATLTAPSV